MGLVVTARDAAIKLIEVYVRRGDSLASLKGSYMEQYTGEGWAARIRGDWILVYHVGDGVDHKFKLSEVYNHIKSGQQGLPL